MKVSVAICTWNRAGLLQQTLQSFRDVKVPPGIDWEIIVVDNASKDDTPRVLTEYAAHLPLVAAFESRPGKSHAANTAVEQATGDLLVWTDDDVIVHAEWLNAYLEAARAYPAAAFFAGPIDPWFEVEPPSWIESHLPELSGVYAIVDHGPECRRMQTNEGVFGANMAFRMDVARQFPLNERLGRIQGSLIGGDDTELIKRVHDAGMHGIWVPAARVRHFVPRQRLTKEYVTRWFRDAGRNYVIQGGLGAGSRTSFGVPTWAIRQWVEAEMNRCVWAIGGGPRWFAHFRRSIMFRGLIAEAESRTVKPAAPAATSDDRKPSSHHVH